MIKLKMLVAASARLFILDEIVSSFLARQYNNRMLDRMVNEKQFFCMRFI